MGHFVSFWPLPNTPDREAYSEFPDSLSRTFVYKGKKVGVLVETLPFYLFLGRDFRQVRQVDATDEAVDPLARHPFEAPELLGQPLYPVRELLGLVGRDAGVPER
jgi:hypothetical protein